MARRGEDEERTGSADAQAVPHAFSEPVPDAVIKRAREAFPERATGEVAHLVDDSLLNQGDPASAHRLMFRSSVATVALEVRAMEANSVLGGTVEGVSAQRVVLHLEGSELALVSAVERDSFNFDPVAHGVVRLSFELTSGPALLTDWFQV